MSEAGRYLIPARCGKDFCECCGDCLHCYGGEECYDGCGDHGSWVIVTQEEAVKWFGSEAEAEQYRVEDDRCQD